MNSEFTAEKGLDQKLGPLVEQLVMEGYSPERAKYKAVRVQEVTKAVLRGCYSQGCLERMLGTSRSKPLNFGRNYLLPAIAKLAEFPFDAGRFALKAAEQEDKNILAASPMLRCFDVWAQSLGDAQCMHVVRKLIDLYSPLWDCAPWQAFAKYSDKLFARFAVEGYEGQELVRRLNPTYQFGNDQRILRFFPPGVFSFLSRDKIDAIFPEASLLLETPLATDAVKPVKHTSYATGVCPDLESYWYKCLEGDKKGDLTFLQVDNSIVAAVKWEGDNNVLGLRTVKDSQERYPVVPGGVYFTDAKLILDAHQAWLEQGKWAVLELDQLRLRPIRMSGPQATFSWEYKDHTEVLRTIAENRGNPPN